VPWVWAGIGVVVAVVLVAAGVRFVTRQYRSAQQGSIDNLIRSSRHHEASGRLDQALIDLDAALLLAEKAEPSDRIRLGEQRDRRRDLALKDARSELDRLVGHDPGSFPLGDWLNLRARVGRDPDLATLQPRIEDQFRAMVRREADRELAAARRSFEAGQAVGSLQGCDRIAKLLPHLPADERQALRQRVEDLVTRLVEMRGVVVEVPRGAFVYGSHSSYVAAMLPLLVKALESKGYLPDRASSPWTKLWTRAPYRMRLDVSERLEGNYFATENRLTLIVARLTLTRGGDEIWKTEPRARTTVPLPKLPAGISSRLAISPKRLEDLERLMYDNARGQIDEKFGYALSRMPAWPGPGP
jgi:hypothetical protein